MIQVRLAAPRRAVRVTGLILAAALLRALLLPLGDALSTIVFGGCLLAISWFEREPSTGEPRWGRGRSLIAGSMVGAILLAPVVTGPLSARGLGAFWSWAAIAAVIASLEETSIRGVLYRRWAGEAGIVAAIDCGAIVVRAGIAVSEIGGRAVDRHVEFGVRHTRTHNDRFVITGEKSLALAKAGDSHRTKILFEENSRMIRE